MGKRHGENLIFNTFKKKKKHKEYIFTGGKSGV